MDQLTTEFSANDLVFAIGTSRGVQINKSHNFFRYYFAVSDGPFSGGQNFTAATTDYTVTGRFEYQFATDQWGIWDDLVGRRGRPFGIMLGIGLGYADGKNGGSAAINSATLLTVDFNINWDGGQAIVYATWRFTDPEAGESFYNGGLVAQGGVHGASVIGKRGAEHAGFGERRLRLGKHLGGKVPARGPVAPEPLDEREVLERDRDIRQGRLEKEDVPGPALLFGIGQ